MNFNDFDFEDLLTETIEIGGANMQYLDIFSVMTLTGIDDKSLFLELYGKVRAKAKNYSLAKALKTSVFPDQETPIFTMIGIYIFLTIAKDYKKYAHLEALIPHFKNEALTDLLKYFAVNENKAKKKKSTVPEEFRPKTEEDYANLFNKKVDAELRKPDLETVGNKEHALYSKNVVVTGNFNTWPQRSELVKLLTSYGAYVKTSINKSTDFVIVGLDAGPSKLKSISDLGLKSYNEVELISLFKLN